MDTVKKYRTYLFSLFIVVALLLSVTIALLFHNGIFLQHPIIGICLLLAFLANALLFYGALHVVTQWESAVHRKSAETQQDSNDKTNITEEVTIEHKNEIKISSQEALQAIEQCKNREEFSNRVLINLSKHIEIVTGLFYARNNNQPEQFNVIGSFAYFSTQIPQPFIVGEGLAGQVVKSKKTLSVANVPNDYISIVSGLGKGSPRYILFIPLPYQGEIVGLLELAAFREINFDFQNFFESEAEFIAEKLLNLPN